MARAPFRIRTRLLQGFLAIVAVMSATAAVIVLESRASHRALDVREGLWRAEIQLLECRRQEKNLLLRNDRTSREAFLEAHRGVTSEIRALLEKARGDRMKDELERLRRAAEAYRDAFVRAARLHADGAASPEELEALMVPPARSSQELLRSLRDAAGGRVRRAAVTAGTVSVAAVLTGAAISLVVVLLLTRSIVTPLERLRRLAEQASTGDLQDADVAFRCLRFERRCSRECTDLADSLRRMVTSLRLLVPTEQGLMGTYHMAILVLVNRAVGPAGRAVIERSLRAGGFSSLTEVGPTTVERFLAALREELRETLAEDSLELLCEAIRELTSEPKQRAPWTAFLR